ncbi:MAG: DUF192 domain-containing protein [Egibacteraceae bacterium]
MLSVGYPTVGRGFCGVAVTRAVTRAALVLAGLLLVMACGSSAPEAEVPGTLQPSEPFDVAELTLRGPSGQAVRVAVYVAAAPRERQRGLMGRTQLPAGAGMVFLYPQPVREPYHMKDTLIPLDIAFYDPQGKVVRVLDMDPCGADPCPRYDPGVAFAGALEVNRGFFRQIGLREGWVVELPKGLPASRGSQVSWAAAKASGAAPQPDESWGVG